VWSARFAGPEASDEDNNRQLMVALAENAGAPRTARYRCVLALVRTDDTAAKQFPSRHIEWPDVNKEGNALTTSVINTAALLREARSPVRFTCNKTIMAQNLNSLAYRGLAYVEFLSEHSFAHPVTRLYLGICNGFPKVREDLSGNTLPVKKSSVFYCHLRIGSIHKYPILA
jgi:hypothetical protein